MKFGPLKALNLLVLLTGCVLMFQCLMVRIYVGPITVAGIGRLGAGTISLFLLQVIGLSAVLVALAAVDIVPKLAAMVERLKVVKYLTLVLGIVLSLEGLALINLSSAITAGIGSSVPLLIGIQLFCLGILSISSYVAANRGAPLIKGIPNHVVLLFLIFLLPAAFMIGT